ncbi:MAG: hypothetical protein K1X95_16585, partial [Acidimicrobiia bacterium]|nr:hypothetical protein [Acidimicrobiia bacterium]
MPQHVEVDPVGAAAASLARRTGLRLPAGSRTRLHDSMVARAERMTDGDLDAYVETLEWDPDEIDALFDLVAVGQTAFWRHPHLFDALEDCILAGRAARSELHLVSAGCSTGEEAWTLAACAAARLGSAAFRVTAIDWCRDALALGREARYRTDALAGMPDRYRRWFESAEEGGADVTGPRQVLRERVAFMRANLLRPVTAIEPADVVLFCNVGIYFDKAATESVVANLAALLRPGGYLFLGAAESLWGLEHDLELVEVGEVFAYRRPRPTAGLAPPTPP